MYIKKSGPKPYSQPFNTDDYLLVREQIFLTTERASGMALGKRSTKQAGSVQLFMLERAENDGRL